MASDFVIGNGQMIASLEVLGLPRFSVEYEERRNGGGRGWRLMIDFC